jgi:hypothetical protein
MAEDPYLKKLPTCIIFCSLTCRVSKLTLELIPVCCVNLGSYEYIGKYYRYIRSLGEDEADQYYIPST